MSRRGATVGSLVMAGALVAGIAGGAVAQDASAVPGGTPMAMPSGPAPTVSIHARSGSIRRTMSLSRGSQRLRSCTIFGAEIAISV